MTARRAGYWLSIACAVFVVVTAAALAAIRFGALDVDLATLERLYATSDSRFLTIEGVRFHYIERGRGPTVVLLHASRGSARMWQGWISVLENSYRVLAIDATGEGLSGLDPTGDYRLERQVSLLRELLQHLGVTAYAVGGTSYGGILAYRLAAEDPRVVGLILANAAGLPRGPGESPNKPEPNPFKRLLYTFYWPKGFFDQSMPRAFGDPRMATPALIQEVYDLARRHGAAKARRARLEQFAIGDVAATLGAVRVPVLVQWSTGRVILPVSEAERFKAYFVNAPVTTHLYPGRGHWLVMEDFATANDAHAFLQRLHWPDAPLPPSPS